MTRGSETQQVGARVRTVRAVVAGLFVLSSIVAMFVTGATQDRGSNGFIAGGFIAIALTGMAFLVMPRTRPRRRGEPY